MAYNKFIKKDGTVMLSLLEDTVTAETLHQGVTAHNKHGEAVTGTLDPNASLNAYASELANIVGDGTQTPSDVEQELNYLLETANRATGIIESTLAETINNLVDGYGANGVVVGKRKFVESPTVPTTYITQQVNFTAIDNNKLTTYTQIGAGKIDNENRISYGSVVYNSTDGWQDENLKIIDFGETPQTVLGEFAQFIADNTEDIDERIVEVATETEMNELFPLAENGTVFKYVGETGTYENGALYVVEEEVGSQTIDFTVKTYTMYNAKWTPLNIEYTKNGAIETESLDLTAGTNQYENREITISIDAGTNVKIYNNKISSPDTITSVPTESSGCTTEDVYPNTVFVTNITNGGYVTLELYDD